MKSHSTPGQLIAELLERRGWSQKTLAVVLEKDESTVNKIVAGKGAVTTETALALEDVFGVDADAFLELQRRHDLAVARLSNRPDKGRATRAALFGDLPISVMAKRGWLSPDAAGDLKVAEKELARFFGVSSASDIEVLPHAAKKTEVNGGDVTPAQLAWIYRVKSIAEEMIVGRYSSADLARSILKLKGFAASAEEVRNIPRILSECGVRFLIVETLPSAKIDGVCLWLGDNSPVVALSMRFDRIDNFWFVLRHELEHVRLGHGKSALILETELEGDKAGTGSGVPEEERLANIAAQDFCVPAAKMDAFIARKAPFFAEADLLGFARMLGVHPGLIAGQLQYKTKRYDRFRQHLALVRDHIKHSAIVDGWGDVYPLGE